jgi:hypothetical protein
MQKFSTQLLIFFIFISACNSSGEKKEKPEFIDVASYLKGQLAYLDSIPFSFEKTTLKDSIYTDTVFLSKEQLRTIVMNFLPKELEKENFQKLYQETLFGDADMNTITLTYQPEEKKDLSVQRVDVYVSPETQEISKLYIIRSNQTKDAALVQQLLWKHNKSCKLITTIYKADNTEQVISEKINWNDTEE